MKILAVEELQWAASQLNRSMTIYDHKDETGVGFRWACTGPFEQMQRLASILGGKAYRKTARSSSDTWSITARADIERVAEVIKPYLNEARQLQLTNAIETWARTRIVRQGDHGVAIVGGKPVKYTRVFRSPFAIT